MYGRGGHLGAAGCSQAVCGKVGGLGGCVCMYVCGWGLAGGGGVGRLVHVCVSTRVGGGQGGGAAGGLGCGVHVRKFGRREGHCPPSQLLSERPAPPLSPSPAVQVLGSRQEQRCG